MKKLTLLTITAFLTLTALGQTNTFPGSGSVGIGTTSPDENLHVTGPGYFHYSTGGLKLDNVYNETANGYVRSSILSSRDGDLEWDSTNDVWTLGSSSTYNDFVGIIHTYNGELGFVTGQQNAFTSLSDSDFRTQFQRVTIDGSGNVGIGTTSPSEKLEISGNMKGPDGESYIKGFKNIIGRSTDGILHLRAGISTGKIFLNYYESGDIILAKGGGSVGIGTTSVPSGYKLAVDGNAIFEEVKIKVSEDWADFVFEDGYNLMPLGELETYIEENKHLPEIPTTEEVEENGISVGEMNAKLLQKIEELTLYVIDLQKQNEAQNKRIKELENK